MDQILAMGFAEYQAKKALAECGDNAEAAINYIMGHMDEPEEFWFQLPEAAPAAAPPAAAKEYPADDAGEHAAALAPLLAAVKRPAAEEAVHKEECAWSFARPTSEAGINVSLSSFLGVGAGFLDFHRQKTGERLYLNITSRRKPKEEPEGGAEIKSTADAINAAAAAATKEYDTTYTLVALLDEGRKEVALEVDEESNVTGPLLPGSIVASIEGVLQHKDMGSAQDLTAFKEEVRETKHHADLPLEDNGKKISPKRADWKCDTTGDVLADKTGPGTSQSLWVNLSDGFIGGERKNWDGSGGNNTAIDHYEQLKAQGKHYPLAVKLGTITPDGADIYSYDEDNSVTMPRERLAQLLARLGIDIMSMVKTEKDMQEMELELNQSFDFGRITGDGSGAVAKGPGFTGMINMGNSCYMNSVCQTLFSLPEFKARYADQVQAIFDATDGDPTKSFHAQFAKLGAALHSGNHSKPGAPEGGTLATAGLPDEEGVKPRALKALVGSGHPEFAGMKQQDAHEYLLYLFDKMERAERAAGGMGAGGNPAELFEFVVEERYEAEGKVKYSKTVEKNLALVIPMEKAVNLEEVAAYNEASAALAAEKGAGGKRPAEDTEPVVPDVPFAAALDGWKASEDGVAFRGGTASKRQRFGTFPPLLAVQIRREVYGEGWVPKKLEVTLHMPETLDLSSLKGTGLAPGETALEDEEGAAEGGAAAPAAEPAPVPEEALMMLMSMGFEQAKCEKALRATDNNTERATEWIFSHMDDDGSPDPQPAAGGDGGGGGGGGGDPAAVVAAEGRDGAGTYELMGFISHIGKSVTSGHYVCHLKKEGRWVIYNDEKVQECENPPLECGYLYFYRRT